MNEDLKTIIKQNEIVIALLGRIAFDVQDVRKIVTKRKKNPCSYIDGYNACNGDKSVSDIAKIIGVRQNTLSPILSEWAQIGIIYEIEKAGGKYYKSIFKI